LAKVIDQYHSTKHEIYNVNKTGITVKPTGQSKILEVNGRSQVDILNSAENGGTVPKFYKIMRSSEGVTSCASSGWARIPREKLAADQSSEIKRCKAAVSCFTLHTRASAAGCLLMKRMYKACSGVVRGKLLFFSKFSFPSVGLISTQQICVQLLVVFVALEFGR
jgi:hypothetical protein